MLTEISGVLQIFTCVAITIATIVWFKIWRHQLKTISEMRMDLIKAEGRINSIECEIKKHWSEFKNDNK